MPLVFHGILGWYILVHSALQKDPTFLDLIYFEYIVESYKRADSNRQTVLLCDKKQ